MESIKPRKRNSNDSLNLEELLGKAMPLLASVLPDLLDSLKSNSSTTESNRFNLDKLMNLLPTLMVLLPGFINSMGGNPSSIGQLQELLPNLAKLDTTNKGELQDQVAEALPVLTRMLQEVSAEGGSNELIDQVNQLISGLGLLK